MSSSATLSTARHLAVEVRPRTPESCTRRRIAAGPGRTEPVIERLLVVQMQLLAGAFHLDDDVGLPQEIDELFPLPPAFFCRASTSRPLPCNRVSEGLEEDGRKRPRLRPFSSQGFGGVFNERFQAFNNLSHLRLNVFCPRPVSRIGWSTIKEGFYRIGHLRQQLVQIL